MEAGIVIGSATDITIDNVHFYETYNGLLAYYPHRLKVTNSDFDRGTLPVGYFYYGIRIQYGDDIQIKDNTIQKYSVGLYLDMIHGGLKVSGNHIHNSTNYGIYTYRLQYGSVSEYYEFKSNILAD